MTDAVTIALPRLMTEEGFRALPYTDTTQHLTIGYGLNLSAGISKALAAKILQWQLLERYQALKAYWWWHEDEPVRGSVILDLAMNLGTAGLLHFVNAIAAYGKKDWSAASAEILNSKAAKEDPARYKELAKLMLEGA